LAHVAQLVGKQQVCSFLAHPVRYKSVPKTRYIIKYKSLATVYAVNQKPNTTWN